MTMYPIGGWPIFHLHGIETESRTFPKPDLLLVTDSVKISHPGLGTTYGEKLGAEIGFLMRLTFLVVSDPNANLLTIFKTT